MGQLVSYEIPSAEQLAAVKERAFFAREDLIADTKKFQRLRTTPPAKLKDRILDIGRTEGGISRDNWVQIFAEFGMEGEGVTNFYDLFNDDGQDWVHPNDVTAYIALVGRKERKAKIKWAFASYDFSSDGFLQAEEFSLMVIGVAKTLRRCNQVLPGLPDAKQEHVTFDEDEIKKLEKAAAKLMEAVDKNHDHKISFKEFQTGADKREVKAILDYFEALTNALPESLGHDIKNKKSKGKSKSKADKGKKSSAKKDSSKKGSKSKGKAKGKSAASAPSGSEDAPAKSGSDASDA